MRSVAALALAWSAAAAQAQTAIRVRNNHDLPFRGPVRFATTLPDGSYGPAAEVRGGVARAVVELAARGDVRLERGGALRDRPFAAGPLRVTPRAGGVDLRWLDRQLGSIELELAVRPGTTATPEEVAPSFRALDVAWTEQADGTLRGGVRRDGYALELTLAPYGGGWVDMTARLTRVDAPTGPAYVALVRRVTTPGVQAPRLRFNGRVVDGLVSPDTWDRDFWYVRGVDWTSWQAGGVSLAAVNGFTPAPTIKRAHRDSAWVEGSHFYVWERTRRDGDHVYLISEVAGPNPGQEKSRYMPVTPYAPMRRGDVVQLEWRLAVEQSPAAGWEESQLRTYAGYRSAARAGDVATMELGVAGVAFGTAYFPYSTLNENFDFYRTPGLDRESFWAFSPTLWKRWRTLAPRMRSDMHIARAMGFAWVRMHHLELLQSMDRAEALAFLDFYMQTARELGLQVVVDSEGPAEWLALVAGRYRDVVKRVELENEILIYGIKQGDAERWTSMYRAVKAVAPETQVFLTSAGNHGMFERLRTLSVPFDRVGLHAYKHGPQWKEAFGSHVLGTADYASDLGLPMTLGEFNWKELTLLSPEARRPEFVDVYERVLENRAVPEFMHFQFQESLSFNPSVSGGFTRHYEPLATDRRPKPEAFELMRLVRKYGPADAPVNELPITVREVRVASGVATAAFTVANNTAAPQTVRLRALAFDGLTSRLASPATLTLQPGERRDGQVELRLASAATVGTYHHFVAAEYDGRTNYGWGVAANMGAPTFSAAPVLGARVTYPQGARVLQTLAWERPLAVAFGAKASVIELEMAYQVMNTLQSATGRPVRLSSVADLPDSLRRDATLVLVGSPESNALVPADVVPDATPAAATKDAPAAPGVLAVRPAEGRGQWLLLTGRDKGAAQAAAVEFILRYWPNAKDAMMRTTGMERGAALGNRAGGVTNADLP